MFLVQYAKSDWQCRNRCQTGPHRDHGTAVAPVAVPAKKREDLRYFTTKFKINETESRDVYFSLDRCVQMRDSKRRARQWIAEVTKNKKPRTRSTRQKTAVPKPPSQVLYILPLCEKPSDMERVAADCLIKAKSVRKGATELGVHRQTLRDAMGRMRCAALPVTQCRRQPRIRQDMARRRRQAGARRAFSFLLFAAVATSRVR